MKNILLLFDRLLATVENFFIFVLLSTMVLMAFLQVILRNFFSTGILWADIFLRHLVLWVGFIGASLATRQEKHINIDILTRVVSKSVLPYVKIAVDVISLIVCILLAKAGYVFVQSEYQARSTLFLNVPAWWFQLIIPLGFAMIGFRFLLKILEQTLVLISGEPGEHPPASERSKEQPE